MKSLTWAASTLLLGTLATAAPYTAVDVTLRSELGAVRVAASDTASPVLGVRTPTVRAGVAFVGATHRQGDWTLGLSPKLPLTLHFTNAQGDVQLDLRRLNLRGLTVRQQLGRLDLTLPALNLKARLTQAQGDVQVRLPPGVGVRLIVERFAQGAVRIGGEEVASGLDFNGTYESANYRTARFRTDLTVDMQLGTLTVQ